LGDGLGGGGEEAVDGVGLKRMDHFYGLHALMFHPGLAISKER
jgi:hypothetical protein